MTDPMTPEELQACRELAEAATGLSPSDVRGGAFTWDGDDSLLADIVATADALAALRTAVPRLLATVDADRAAVAAREERIAELASELADLRRRVVANVTHGKQQPHPRWAHVMRATGYGSTRATELCRLAGFDPDEEIGSWPEPCEACAEEEGDEESEDE